jgi:hypothetical protein
MRYPSRPKRKINYPLSATRYPLLAISFHIVMDEVGEWDEAAGLA